MHFLFSLLFSFNTIATSHAVDKLNETTKSEMIYQIEEDITKDGISETIHLHGMRLAENSNYFHDVVLTISSLYAKTWKKTLQKGYDPKISLVDITNDQHLDFLYSVAMNEEKTSYQFDLFQMKKGELIQIPLPKQENIRIHYKDHFLMTVQLPLQKRVHTIDRTEHKKALVEKGIYDDYGNALIDTNMAPKHTTKIEPVFLTKQNGYALKTIQDVHGMTEDDLIGSIHTWWYHKEGKWIVLQTEWKETEK